MRIKIIITNLFLSIFCIQVNAQIFFKGKVIEAGTDKPIAYASVYVNGSSQGSTTNNKGEFNFTSSIYIGELIITNVGFQTISYPFNNPKAQNLLIKLDRKDNTLDEILILTDEERAKYLKIFKDNFLGQTQEAKESKIQNVRDIYFIRNADKSKGFTAKADSSLVIISNRTGYKITFTLEGFSFNSNNNTTFFYGYTKYDDLIPFKKKYLKHRLQIYQGSTMHFFRNMADNSSRDSAFSMMELMTIENNGRKFDQGIPRGREYLVKTDSSESSVFTLKFKERLRVLYSKSTSSLKDLSLNFFISITSAGFPVSTLNLIDSAIYFDKNGIVLNPLGMMYSGYWSFEKAANMLPSDYKPTSELK